MDKLITFLSKKWPYLFLSGVLLLLFVANYTPGTYLTGWDNLNSEFNFGLNINRAFNSVWQEYQGVGLLAGMGHAADLFREIFLWLVSFVLPNSFLRYFYHFLMLFIGTIGMYFLLSRCIFPQHPKGKSFPSLLGALFYLLNLGTIQYFYVPFEPYSTFWGFFPWEMFVLFLYMQKSSKRNLLFLALINLLAVAQGYVQTIFLVYCICVGIFLVVHTLLKKITWKKTWIVLLVIFCVNAFWLLPNLYFVVHDLNVTQNAMQNEMATDKFFQMNKSRGTLLDFPLLREFYYDFYDYNQKSYNFDYLMKSWRDYQSSPIIPIVGYLLFGVILVGITRRNPYRLFFYSIFSLSLLIFLSETIGFAQLNDIFRTFPLINQIFRNPFTKFIVPTIFVFSIYFALGIDQLIKITKRSIPKYSTALVVVISLLFIGIYNFPAFEGQFIAPQMRVVIPNEYFQLFSFFQKQDPTARIANLPQGSFWGWDYYKWGIVGSGFLWYGIQQPIMDRAFDVWSSQNEDYYWQLSYALKKQDPQLLNTVLKKYDIGFVLFDKNLFFADTSNSYTNIQEQETLLMHDPFLKKVATFNNIIVFSPESKMHESNNISLQTNLISNPKTEQFNLFDPTYIQYGNYTNSGKTNAIYPFNSLFTNRLTTERASSFKETNNTLTLSHSVPSGTYTLEIPSLYQSEQTIPVIVSVKREQDTFMIRLTSIQPTITVGGSQITIPENTQDISLELPASTYQSPLMIVFNKNDVLTANNPTNSFTRLGEIYLSTQANVNYLKIYSGKTQATTLSSQEFLPAHMCGAAFPYYSYTSSATNNEVALHAKNTAICSTYGQALPQYMNSLLRITFTSSSKSDEFPQYCLYGSAVGCFNQKDIITTGFDPKQQISDYIEIDNIPYANFDFILDATNDQDKNINKTITYQNTTLTAYPYITGGIFNITKLHNQPQELQVNIPTASTIDVTIPKMNTGTSSFTPMKQNIYKTDSLNYDKILEGSYSLQKTSTGLTASAIDSSSYINFHANNLSPSEGYLVKTVTKNTSGSPFTLDVFSNKDLRTYLYTFSSPAKKNTISYYVLPPLSQFDQGIDFLFGSTSYNQTPTVNTLQNLAVYPLPFTFISGLQLRTFTQQPTSSSLIPLSSHHISTWQYTATIPNNHPNTTLILSQGYNEDWLAYYNGKQLTNHMLVDNWANGWQLPAPDTRSQIPDTIVILFWPQYLEYVGFGLTLCFFAGAGIHAVRAKRKK